MEAQGSSSSWAFPLHTGEKADSSWQLFGDYWLLSLATKLDLYPPPHMEDLSAQLAGMKILSKLDLRKGAEDHRQHTIWPLRVQEDALQS